MNFGKRSILVVDNDEISRDILAFGLESRGLTVESVDSGSGILQLVSERYFNAILVDVLMPEPTGSEIVRRVRQRYSMTELPVIMVSARNESQHVVEALTLGANDFVTRPVDIDLVLTRIQTYMSLRRAEEELLKSVDRDEEPAETAHGFGPATPRFCTPLTAKMNSIFAEIV